MRNLRCLGRSTFTFGSDVQLASKACWDAATGDLIFACGPSKQNATVELKRLPSHAHTRDEARLIASWDAPSPTPDLATDQILALQYFGDTETICVILAGGDLIFVKETPLPGEDQIEIVGSVDAGLLAARWSPDEELLVIVTKQNTCIFMSRDLEPISEASFSPEDAKLSKHVNVGWGKKETQFQGKRAKALRDPTMPEYVDEGLVSSFDYKGASISWRGDGQYVAINSREEETRRIIRVYSRDGILDSVSEPVDYLESTLSWRPSGNLLAAIQRKGSQLQVVFFERNGLRHGQFPLRVPPEASEDANGWASAISLEWNSDSSVLAVSYKDRVQLWTMGNYHYYLKQELMIPPSAEGAVDVRWHAERRLHFTVASQQQISRHEFASYMHRGSTTAPKDLGMVCVIDGNRLKVTPLRTTNIPPPMALLEIEVASPIVDCIIDSYPEIVILERDQITCWTYDGNKCTNKPEKIGAKSLTLDDGEPAQIAFLDMDFEVLMHRPDTAKRSVMLYRFDDNAFGLEASNHRIPDDVASIYSSGEHAEHFMLQSSSGRIATPNNQGFSTPNSGPTSFFPQFCPWVEFVDTGRNSLVAFGQATDGSLYANARKLATNCTSFAKTANHLIFTTTNHLLKFVHLATDGTLDEEELVIPSDEPEVDERCRTIERGAKIITVIPSTYALVLQMPRGNLETIYPRALVLAGIRQAIGRKDYKTAFMACRNQRVDMNILHDHAPEQFMANVGTFIEQLKKVTFIDLFLSQLREEDVSQTMYKETLQKPLANGINGISNTIATTSPNSAIPNPSKVNRICDAFLATLKPDTPSALQNIITANVCKSPPDLIGGLSVISQLRKAGDELAERAAEHICFLADVNRLYDTALGMYDLDLTLQIAQQSQKDPREYLPYLQKLEQMTELRRKFTIDHDLEKRDQAIEHLHSMDEFEELKSYAERWELYSKAIELYKYQESRLNELMALYAAFLLERNRYMEAGIAYEFLQDHESALSAYRSSSSYWREALFCASMIPLSTEDTTSLARDLAEALIESKDNKAAASIYLDYLQDIDTAARLLCKAASYSEALRLSVLHIPDPATRKTFLTDTLDPSLLESFATTTELLADCKSQLAAQIPRLRELRVKKAEDPLAFYGGDPSQGQGDQDFPDNISLAPTDASTSGGTFMTRYTGRNTLSTVGTNATRKTSKNRRREERKRARGKKGSVYEEEYLVNSIGRLIERVNSVSEDVKALVEVLMRRGMRERAVALETAMAVVVEACQACLVEVFPGGVQAEKKVGGEGLGEDGEMMGADAVYADAIEGLDKIVAPVVQKFEKLALLA